MDGIKNNKELLEELRNKVDELNKEEFLELLHIIGTKKYELFDLCGIECEDESIPFKEFFRNLFGMELISFQQFDSIEEKNINDFMILEFQVEIEQPTIEEDEIEE